MASPLQSLLVFLLFLSAAAARDPLGEFCNKHNNITPPILANIDRLLANLVSRTSAEGYAATSYGGGQDTVYGLAQCRGDVSTGDCSACIRNASKEVRQRCQDQADARIWYDYCFLRYAQNSFAGDVDTSVGIFYYNVENVTEPGAFKQKLGTLMDRVRSEAVSAANKGLGKGETEVSSLVTLYALAQCTRDLAPLSCAQCVAIAVEKFGTVCKDRKGCRVLYSSCYVRYELYPFYFPLNSNSTADGASSAVLLIFP